jgi:fatty acid desaturase
VKLRELAAVVAFPAVTVAAEAAAVAWWPSARLAALGALAGAVVALNYSVHVSFHECVHRNCLRGPLALGRLVATAIMGMPFDGYVYHHRNHHAYNNGLEDFSSTWRRGFRSAVPMRLVPYALAWPRQTLRAGRQMRFDAARGHLDVELARRCRLQRWLLAALVLALGVRLPHALVMYLVTIYGGWTLIAVHNYGQHFPEAHPGEAATSFAGRRYNALFANNGLHWEHHHRPSLPWWQLERAPAGRAANAPHPVWPLVRRRRAPTSPRGLQRARS